MTSRKLYILAVCLLLLNTQIDWGDASFLDYIWPDKRTNYFGGGGQSLPSVPFELAEESDKFILDAAKLMGNKISELDFCQQRVILQLKNSCKSLNEDQIAKLAIALMNCQSQNEGREVFECSENVPLKDCVSAMSAEAWNNYNQHLSRAKAICLTVRQDQFRAVAEMTVNKLMEATNQNLQKMEELKTSQKQLQQAAIDSFDEIAENNLKLVEKQQELLRLAEAQRLSTENNMREILKEKSFIRSGQIEITNFITNLKNKIEDGLTEIDDHSANIQEVYTKLASDLSNLNEAVQTISESLERASESIIEQNEKATNQIEDTILHLQEANNIVRELSGALTGLRRDFEERVAWLTKYFGGSENFIQVFPVVAFHIIYLLIGMICLVFVNADYLSRCLFLSVLCLNLAAVLYGFIDMDLALLTETIVALLLAHNLAKVSRKFEWKKLLAVSDATKKNSSIQNGYISRINLNRREPTPLRREGSVINGYSDSNVRPRRAPSEFRSMASHQSGSMNEDDQLSDRSRSTTPIHTTTLSMTGNRCKALTVRGTQCQLTTASVHTEFCRIHERPANEHLM